MQSLTIPRWWMGAAADSNGSIYFAGGVQGLAPTWTCQSVIDVLDTTTNIMTTLTMPSGPRYAVRAFVLGMRVYFAGGYLCTGSSTGVVDVYDLVTKSWAASQALQSSMYRGSVSAAASSKGAIVAGGRGANHWICFHMALLTDSHRLVVCHSRQRRQRC